MPESTGAARSSSVWPRVEGSPGPPRHPRRWKVVRHAVGLSGLLCAGAALAIDRQDAVDSVLILAGLSDRAWVPLLVACAAFLLALWITMVCFHAPTRSTSGRVLVRTFGTGVMIVGSALSLICLFIFTLTASTTTYHRFDIPGSDDDLLVVVRDGLGDSTVELYLGGPRVFSTGQGPTATLNVYRDVVVDDSVRVETDGDRLVVVVTTSGGEDQRLVVPSAD